MNTVETRRQLIVNRRPSGVLFVLLDCETKLNYLGTSTMNELDEVLEYAEKDPLVKAVVMMSGKPDHFIIGADVFEFRKFSDVEAFKKLSSDGQRTMNTVAGLKKPTLVAINGTCLGGGLELALAAHWRIATDAKETILGLPEVKLGLIPGLGGTQRLPRLVGLKASLGMILSGDPISVSEALIMGLVDEVVAPENLMDAAEKRALALVEDSSEIKERLEQWAEPEQEATGIKATRWCLRDLDEAKATKLFAMTERSMRIKTRGNYPAQSRVIDVIKTGVNEGITKGLLLESQVFGEMAVSDVSANLTALVFSTDFARQSAASMANKFGAGATSNIGIVGGGGMGTSIAALSASNDINVALKVKDGRESQSMEAVKAAHPKSKSAPTEGTHSEDAIERVHCTDSYDNLAGAQLVLETVSEDLAVKTAVLREMEKAVDQDCVIATNTSSLPLAELAKAIDKNDRFVGLHFFHPVDKMMLVEIVALKSTSRKALARAAEYISRLGKLPVMVKDGPGFLINRLLTCYLLESARAIEEGVPMNWIEEAATEFGMPIGPMEVLDEVGPSLGLSIAATLHEAFGPRMKPPAILQAAARLGLGGRKTGSGIYLWDENGRRREFNPALSAIPQIKFSSEKAPDDVRKELARRLIFPMIDEAGRCLEERIVMKPREIDMAIVYGIGFPPFRGGILKYADHVGLKEVASVLKQIYSASKESERQVCGLIERYIGEGRNFYSLGGKEEE